ncbi:hypothetical protein HOLleu_21923 [Holothuria leucospilota]|uniref:Uncharacterized protein n=1 Tax=Holothuria leucospilota TaxID=206669 RepID=A0A9Q1BXW1_HOLLE|nr:hypothetical protein HOLleu_21923 [Holothuria leucospilota]
MEPTAIVLGAQHKQCSRENKPVSHNWKKLARLKPIELKPTRLKILVSSGHTWK